MIGAVVLLHAEEELKREHVNVSTVFKVISVALALKSARSFATFRTVHTTRHGQNGHNAVSHVPEVSRHTHVCVSMAKLVTSDVKVQTPKIKPVTYSLVRSGINGKSGKHVACLAMEVNKLELVHVSTDNKVNKVASVMP